MQGGCHREGDAGRRQYGASQVADQSVTAWARKERALGRAGGVSENQSASEILTATSYERRARFRPRTHCWLRACISDPPETFVVDASVGVKLFLDETGADEAERLFALLGRDPPHVIAVPDLFFIECANVFRSRVHRRLMTAALDLALVHGLSVYDATYTALADRLGVPLVTADGKLEKKLDEGGRKAILLK